MWLKDSSIGRKFVMALSGAALVFFLLFHGCMNLALVFSEEAYNAICRFLGANWVTDKKPGVTWESENMLVLGFTILGFLCLHLYNFWFKMQFAELSGVETGAFDPQNGAAYVKALFTEPVWGQIYCVLYLLWLVVLWLHLNHGVGSAMTSMGLNNLKWQKRVEVISTVVATLVVLPFTIVVLYYLGMGIGMLCA